MAFSKYVSYNFLGASGMKVSNICLGTMTFGESGLLGGQCNEDLSVRILDRFSEMGGNFIDTADVYNSGASERIVGKWLQKQEREQFVIATKVRFSTDKSNANSTGLSRKHILSGIEQSLDRLATHYIDLYQVHCWDAAVNIDHLLRTLNDLVRCGKIRHVGLSNVTGWQMQKLVDTSKYMGLEPFVSLQAQYNLLCRQTEWELQEICKNEKISLLPWSPLKGGWLSGKYRRHSGAPPSDTRVGWVSEDVGGRRSQSCPSYEQYNTEQTWHLLHVMADIAHETKSSVSQVALRWLLQRDSVPSVIIGVKSLQQLEDNMAAARPDSPPLTQQQMSALDAASHVDVPYPYEMVWRCQRDRQEGK